MLSVPLVLHILECRLQVEGAEGQQTLLSCHGAGKLDKNGALQNSLFIFSCLHIIICTDFGFLGFSKSIKNVENEKSIL